METYRPTRLIVSVRGAFSLFLTHLCALCASAVRFLLFPRSQGDHARLVQGSPDAREHPRIQGDQVCPACAVGRTKARHEPRSPPHQALRPPAFQLLRRFGPPHGHHRSLCRQPVDVPVSGFVGAQMAVDAGSQSAWAVRAAHVGVQAGGQIDRSQAAHVQRERPAEAHPQHIRPRRTRQIHNCHHSIPQFIACGPQRVMILFDE